MRACLAVAILVGGLVAAGSASAETQLSADGASLPTAAGSWVSWSRDYRADGQTRSEWTLWHGGAFAPTPQVYTRTLGTDAGGRAVALDRPCEQCRVVERRLADGSVRPLPRRAVHAVDEDHGNLAYGRRGLGLYLLRRGARHVTRLSRVEPTVVALSRRWLVYWSFRGGPGHNLTTIRAIDLRGPKPRERLLARNDTEIEDCRCTDSFVREQWPAVAGHYGYWVELRLSGREGPNLPRFDSRILRVDLAAKRPVVETFTPEHVADAIAVAGTTLYYTVFSFDTTAAGIFRVDAPQWRKTSRHLPVHD